MDDVKENPWSEICWYMPESREQYRLSGKLYIITSDEKDAELKKVIRVMKLMYATTYINKLLNIDLGSSRQISTSRYCEHGRCWTKTIAC